MKPIEFLSNITSGFRGFTPPSLVTNTGSSSVVENHYHINVDKVQTENPMDFLNGLQFLITSQQK